MSRTNLPLNSFYYKGKKDARDVVTSRRFQLAVLAILVLCTFLLLASTISDARKPKKQPVLSRLSDSTFDIVVSEFKENLTAVAQNIQEIRDLAALDGLSIRLNIYTKDPEVDLAIAKQIATADRVV
ncbi:hypothetical protein LTS18_000269, partial [Coniosporium uncinatum]